VQLLVATGRNEIVAQRFRLQELTKLPDEAKKAAIALAEQETSHAEARRREMAMGFDQLAEVVTYRAKQSMDAVRAVPLPDMSNPETAADDYRRYAYKVDQVYQTCLPFLRKAISNLYTFVGCEAPSSWPDSLPMQKELPEELIRIPVADSNELQQAQGTLKALAEEDIQLARMRDELTANLSRIDSELAAAQVKESEVAAEIATASTVVEYVALQEQIEAATQEAKSLAQQKTERVRAAGQVSQQHKQTEAAIAALTEELTQRTEELGSTRNTLEQVKGDEPVLFGKEEWRGKVQGLEGKVEELSTTYTQRLGVLNQLKIDLSALSVNVHTEQAQLSLIDRALVEALTKHEASLRGLREMGQRLGASKPARPMRLDEATQALAVREERRADILERIERFKADQRRIREDGTRVIARVKQIEVERQHTLAMVQSAQTVATQGRDAALRQLAAQRRKVVEQHVGEVLGALDKSLTSVGSVFVEPAREAMMKRLARVGAGSSCSRCWLAARPRRRARPSEGARAPCVRRRQRRLHRAWRRRRGCPCRRARPRRRPRSSRSSTTARSAKAGTTTAGPRASSARGRPSSISRATEAGSSRVLGSRGTSARWCCASGRRPPTVISSSCASTPIGKISSPGSWSRASTAARSPVAGPRSSSRCAR
jgi:hypothetical protein